MNRSTLIVALTLGCAAPMSMLALASETSTAPVAAPAQQNPDQNKDHVKNPTMDPMLTPTGQAVSADVKLQYATFGAGCFWGVEQRFRETPGVIATGVGYAGGHTPNPTYKEVCADTTGHAEVVQVQFDPTKTSYDAMLQVFWDNHNPTTLNRQGPDVGTQYRSAIFFHDDAQKAAAEKSKSALAESGKWGKRPIVTEIATFTKFHRAEEYHQQYLEKRGMKVCH